MTAGVWAIALVGGLITFIFRFAFIALAHRAGTVPPGVREALRMIPPAALAALVAPAVFRSGPGGALALTDPRVLAAAAALVVMWRTRQVLLTLVVGMGTLIAIQQLT